VATRRILIVSYYFPPFNGAVTQHAQRLVRYLPQFGYEPHVLASSVFHGENSSAPPVEGHVHSVPRGERAQRAALALGRAEMYAQVKARMWDMGFAWAAAFGYPAARRLIDSGGFEGIISISPSLSSHWLAYRLKRRRPQLRWLMDFADPLVGNPFRHAVPIVQRWEERFERRLFEAADAIGANTEPVRELWMERYPEIRDRFHLLPNGFDLGEYVAPLRTPPRDAPVLAHVGAVYGGRLPNDMFEAMYELAVAGRLAPRDLTVEFLGASNFDRARRPECLAWLREHGYVRIMNQQVPRAQALRYAGQADLQLLLDVTEPYNTRLQLPSKIFDYLRIGRPVLAFTAEDSPAERVLAQSGIVHQVIYNRQPLERVMDGLQKFLRLPRDVRQPAPALLEQYDARRIAATAAALIAGRSSVMLPAAFDLRPEPVPEPLPVRRAG
jgi:glycosyltransferase involved in cell wall biosynthesis